MWFCPDSVDHTWQVTSSITQAPARVPQVWPVEEGTNITLKEIEMLENAGFKLEKAQEREEGRESRYRTGVSEAANRRINSAVSMEATVVQHKVIKANQHELFQLQTATSQLKDMVYDVHISKKPCCSCPDFVQRMAQGQSYVACKHIYYILVRVFGMDVNHNLCIHQANLSNEDLYRIFQNRRIL